MHKFFSILKSSSDNYIGIEQGRFTNGRTSEGLYLSI